MRHKKDPLNREQQASFSVERTPNWTMLRLLGRESLAGADLGSVSRLWNFLDEEYRDPKPVVVVLAPPELLSPRSLERLLRGPDTEKGLTAAEVRGRIIRESNVIQRFIESIRGLDSFVVGVVGGEVAFRMAAPLLACDYRIVSSDSAFVNTTQSLPRAPLNCLPWLLAKLVGGAKASQILLDVPRLTADDALNLGLVNLVASPDRLEEAALGVAKRLSSLPLATLVSLKRGITASSSEFHHYVQQEQTTTEQLASEKWNEITEAKHENRHSRS